MPRIRKPRILSKILGYAFGIGIALLILIFVSNYFNTFPIMGDKQALELRIHDLVNQERIKNGHPPLSYDPTLAEIARKHSEEMARSLFLTHFDSSGGPTDRANKAGYSCYKSFGLLYSTGIGENIMQNNLHVYDMVYLNAFDSLSTSTVNGWMNSFGHRSNILSSSYDREGIGVAIIQDRIYITQNFC